MPKFTYTVKDINGKSKTDMADALSRAQLITDLQRNGFFIIDVKELRPGETYQPAQLAKKQKFTHKKVKLEDLIIFARQLTAMLDAGVNLLRSLNVILSQVESEQLFKVMSKIKADVELGSSLSAAIEKHPKVFDQFWVSLIEVGEASGTMPTILQKLAFYLEQQAAFKATIISAVIYPAILFCVATGAVAFFALVIGPRFEDVFKSMGVQLPLITIVLLGTFAFLRTKFLWILGGIILFVFAFKKYCKTPAGKLQFEKIMFSLPTVGGIYKLIILERFSSQMAILIDSGVPILYALDITQRLVNNMTCAKVVHEIKEGVRQGRALVGPMQKSNFFPPMAIQMIMVGEETGELSKMLKHVSNYYQTTVETFMKRFGTIIEPIMLVFMGVVIGTIVIAMFLPMFNISKLGGGGG